MEPDQHKPVRVFLLHGTWGRNSPWTGEQSLIGIALRSALPQIDAVNAIRWSGGNTFHSRFAAARELNEAIDKIDENTNIMVCAHSHGGAVLAYALRERPALAERLVGAVFLSTPFLLFRVVPSWRLLIDGLLTPLPILAYMMLAVLAVAVGLVARIAQTPWMPNRGDADYVYILLFSFLIIFGFGIAGSYLLMGFNRWKLRISRKVLNRARRIVDQYSCRLPSATTALFIHVSGDEAAVSMGFFQTLLWFLMLLNVLAARLYSFVAWPFSVRRLQHPLRLWLGIGAFAFLLALSVTDIFVNIGNPDAAVFMKTWRQNYTNLRGIHWERMDWEWLAPYIFLDTVMGVLNILMIALIVMFALSVTILTMNWSFSLWFGRMPLLYGGIVQVAVENTPPGDWTVIHSTWDREGRSKKRLLWRHSEAYSNPKVIAQIVGWLKSAV